MRITPEFHQGLVPCPLSTTPDIDFERLVDQIGASISMAFEPTEQQIHPTTERERRITFV